MAKDKKQKYPTDKLYGWYSASQAEVGGSCHYDTPSGDPVEITCITSSPTQHGTTWKDITCVGEVTRYLSYAAATRIKKAKKPEKKPTREDMVSFARGVVDSTSMPKGGRIVVLVTDEEGAFMGVASNCPGDIPSVLTAALRAKDARPA